MNRLEKLRGDVEREIDLQCAESGLTTIQDVQKAALAVIDDFIAELEPVDAVLMDGKTVEFRRDYPEVWDDCPEARLTIFVPRKQEPTLLEAFARLSGLLYKVGGSSTLWADVEAARVALAEAIKREAVGDE